MALAPWLQAARNHYAPPPADQTWATPGDLARTIDPRTIQTPALDLIDAELARLLDTPDGRLIISMPPQEGKSTRVGRDLPIWALTRNPELRIVTGSYAQNLANRNGRMVRNAITANPTLGLAIAHDNGAASEWSIEGHQGGMISVGRGAGINGRPADLLVVDDPLKDRAEADSAVIRDNCWDWWTDALSARLSPGAPVVLITTRWHEDDLVGRLMSMNSEAGWKLLNIPAQCEDPLTDPLRRSTGEFMQSARGRTTAQWELRKSTAGPRTWAALYQGHPSPPEGGILRRDAWRYWRKLPPLADCKVIQSWDLAFKGGATSDFVVGQVWAQHGADLYLIDQTRGRLTFSETIAAIRELTAKWPQAGAKYVEDKANGPAVLDALTHEIPGLIPVQPEGGKEARANAVTYLVDAGNVWLPDPATHPWVPGLVEEAAGFPNAAHDDQVDALTQALTKLTLTASRTGGMMYDLG